MEFCSLSLSIHDSFMILVSLGLSLRPASRFSEDRINMSCHPARQGHANRGDDEAALTRALALQRLSLWMPSLSFCPANTQEDIDPIQPASQFLGEAWLPTPLPCMNRVHDHSFPFPDSMEG